MASDRIPTLDEKHSGVPTRNLDEAYASKARLYSNKTVPPSRARTQDVPALPPDVDRTTFNKAIVDLKRILGDDNVEVNDKPLVDGWYMEHPYVDTFLSPIKHKCTRVFL